MGCGVKDRALTEAGGKILSQLSRAIRGSRYQYCLYQRLLSVGGEGAFAQILSALDQVIQLLSL